MTFGETLKTIMTASGIKGNQLAAAIGYDTSYISRWLTNDKLPAYNKNDGLFKRIAEYVVSACNADECISVMEDLELFDGKITTPDEMRDAIESILKSSYEKQKSIMSDIRNSTKISENSIMIRDFNSDIVFSMIAETVYDVFNEPGSASVEIITTLPVKYGNNSGSFLNFLNEIKNSSHLIHVRHLVDINQARAYIDEYCRSLLDGMVQLGRLKYDYYLTDQSQLCNSFFIAVKDKLYIRQIDEPFSLRPNIILTKDPLLVTECFHSAERYIQKIPPIFAKGQAVDQKIDSYLLNYMMQNEFWHIQTIMHPLYVGEEFCRELFYEKIGTREQWNYSFATRMHLAKKTVIVYKSAIIDYIFNGKIILSGMVNYFSVEKRIRHLRELQEFLSTHNQCRLIIVEDNNPLLCYKDLSQSIYISNRAAYATCFDGEKYSATCNDIGLVELFQQFAVHLANMPEIYAIKGQQVIDYLNNAIEWLESNIS